MQHLVREITELAHSDLTSISCSSSIRVQLSECFVEQERNGPSIDNLLRELRLLHLLEQEITAGSESEAQAKTDAWLEVQRIGVVGKLKSIARSEPLQLVKALGTLLSTENGPRDLKLCARFALTEILGGCPHCFRSADIDFAELWNSALSGIRAPESSFPSVKNGDFERELNAKGRLLASIIMGGGPHIQKVMDMLRSDNLTEQKLGHIVLRQLSPAPVARGLIEPLRKIIEDLTEDGNTFRTIDPAARARAQAAKHCEARRFGKTLGIIAAEHPEDARREIIRLFKDRDLITLEAALTAVHCGLFRKIRFRDLRDQIVEVLNNRKEFRNRDSSQDGRLMRFAIETLAQIERPLAVADFVISHRDVFRCDRPSLLVEIAVKNNEVSTIAERISKGLPKTSSRIWNYRRDEQYDKRLEGLICDLVRLGVDGRQRETIEAIKPVFSYPNFRIQGVAVRSLLSLYGEESESVCQKGRSWLERALFCRDSAIRQFNHDPTLPSMGIRGDGDYQEQRVWSYVFLNDTMDFYTPSNLEVEVLCLLAKNGETTAAINHSAKVWKLAAEGYPQSHSWEEGALPAGEGKTAANTFALRMQPVFELCAANLNEDTANLVIREALLHPNVSLRLLAYGALIQRGRRDFLASSLTPAEIGKLEFLKPKEIESPRQSVVTSARGLSVFERRQIFPLNSNC